MNRFIYTTFFLICLLIPCQLFGQNGNGQQYLTLFLPGSILAQAVDKMVPFDVNVSSKVLKGSVSIISIDNIQLKNQQISCRLGLIGKNLRLVSEIAGHKINLNVGSIQLNFVANARLRFDAKKQMLYIRPLLENKLNSPPKTGDIESTLLALISGRDFPVSIKKLKPLVADTEDKSIVIGMKIRNIEAVNNALKISISPTVSNVNPTISKKK